MGPGGRSGFGGPPQSAYVDKYAKKYEEDDETEFENYHNRFAAEDGMEEEGGGSNFRSGGRGGPMGGNFNSQQGRESFGSRDLGFGAGRGKFGDRNSFGNDGSEFGFGKRKDFNEERFGERPTGFGGRDFSGRDSFGPNKGPGRDAGFNGPNRPPLGPPREERPPAGFNGPNRPPGAPAREDRPPVKSRWGASNDAEVENHRWAPDKDPEIENEPPPVPVEPVEEKPHTCVVVEYNHRNVPAAMSIQLVKGYNEPYKGPVFVYEYSHGANKRGGFFRERAASPSQVGRRRSPLRETKLTPTLNRGRGLGREDVRGREGEDGRGRDLLDARGRDLLDGRGRDSYDSRGRGDFHDSRGRGDLLDSRGRDLQDSRGRELPDGRRDSLDSRGRDAQNSRGRDWREFRADTRGEREDRRSPDRRERRYRDRSRSPDDRRRDRSPDDKPRWGAPRVPDPPRLNSFDERLAEEKKKYEDKSRHVEQKKLAIDDLLESPGRHARPEKIAVFIRGPPCSGKSFIARIIRDKEAANGGERNLRILSVDDYFMTKEVEKEIQDERGFKKRVKAFEYEYEAEMEASYRQSLVKSFKKHVNDGLFSFLIVDANNDQLSHYSEMYLHAKSKGFAVYVIETTRDLAFCLSHNERHREESDIRAVVETFQVTPREQTLLDITSLLQEAEIEDVEMEDVSEEEKDVVETVTLSGDEEDDDDDIQEIEGGSKFTIPSKWDNIDHDIGEIKAKLDGLCKKSAGTIRDWLNDDSNDELSIYNKTRQPSDGGKKKQVRWADIEEKYEQDKMKAIGFIVGGTDWNRMLDPNSGEKRMNQTKYI